MGDARRFDGIPFNNQNDAPKAAAIGEEAVSEKPVEVINLLNEKILFILSSSFNRISSAASSSTLEES